MNTKVRNSVAGKYDTVAKAKAGIFVSGQTVKTKGYTTPGDGGGADYLIKTAVEAAADGDAIDEERNFTLDTGDVAIKQKTIVELKDRRPRKLHSKIFACTAGISSIKYAPIGDSLALTKPNILAANLDRLVGGTNRFAANVTGSVADAGKSSAGADTDRKNQISITAETGREDKWLTGNLALIAAGGSFELSIGGVNPTCDSVSVYYLKEAGAGTLTLNVNSVDVASASAAGTNGVGIFTHSKTLDATTIKLSATGAGVRVIGTHVRNTTANGVDHHHLLLNTGGLYLYDAMQHQDTKDNLTTVLNDAGIDTFHFEMDDGDFSLSDPSVAFNDLTDILDSTSPYADKIIITSTPRAVFNNGKQASDEYLKNFVINKDRSYLIFDSFNLLGSYAEMTAIFGADDGTHPSANAQAYAASILWNFLGLNSPLMGLNSRAINDNSTPSIVADGSKFQRKEEFMEVVSDPYGFNWQMQAPYGVGIAKPDGTLVFNIGHNGGAKSFMPSRMNYDSDTSDRYTDSSTSNTYYELRHNDETKDTNKGNMVLTAIPRCGNVPRATLVAGDYPASSMKGSLVRCSDGNAGDGIYVAVGTSPTDWQKLTYSGAV